MSRVCFCQRNKPTGRSLGRDVDGPFAVMDAIGGTNVELVPGRKIVQYANGPKGCAPHIDTPWHKYYWKPLRQGF
jgi:hypothetical protein